MKKIPVRRCIATGESCPKKDLLRVCKNNAGEVFFDYTSKANGRGAYIKASEEALQIAKNKKCLEKALECEIPEKVYEALLKEINARKN